MNDLEIKCEFPFYENQCRVCLSVGRKLSPLGEYSDIFNKIMDDAYQNADSTQLCWECIAVLRRVCVFQQQSHKAHASLQLGQALYGTLSNLSTIILNDGYPHTLYMHETNLQTRFKEVPRVELDIKEVPHIELDIKEVTHIDPDVKAVPHNELGVKAIPNNELGVKAVPNNELGVKAVPDNELDDCDNFDDISLQGDNNIKEVVKSEGIVPVTRELEIKKPTSNRWAMKRALLNKKPKFKILTDYIDNCFKKIVIKLEDLSLYLENQRESEYFKSKRFKCNKCVLSFDSEKALLQHKRNFHGKLTPYTCDICDSRMSDKRRLARHVSQHYHKYACTLCEFTCCDKSLRHWHHQKKHRRIFQCVKCKLKFGNRKEFFKHYKEWHEKFICDYCGVSFKLRYCIKDHIRKQHSPFSCTLCDKQFARYGGLWLHNKTAHAQTRAPAYCVECDSRYPDVYRYRWHLANSARHNPRNKPRVPCPGCDKVFSKNIYMKDHYNLVHLKYYKYRCEQCDKNFIRNADLQKHSRRVHEGILPPKNKICSLCGRGFSTNKILSNHVRTHTGERPHACPTCGARFAQSAALRAHARALHCATADT